MIQVFLPPSTKPIAVQFAPRGNFGCIGNSVEILCELELRCLSVATGWTGGSVAGCVRATWLQSEPIFKSQKASRPLSCVQPRSLFKGCRTFHLAPTSRIVLSRPTLNVGLSFREFASSRRPRPAGADRPGPATSRTARRPRGFPHRPSAGTPPPRGARAGVPRR